MATVIAVIVIISIILSIIYSMPSILSQHERQTTIDKANKGDASAQFWLGRMYYFGDGVPKDYKEAVKWYNRECPLNRETQVPSSRSAKCTK